MVMPSGMADLLARKYSIMQQQADTQSMAAKAAANLDSVRASLMPKESAANIASTMANTAMTEKNTSWIDRLNEMGINLTKSQVGLNNANVGETKARTTLLGSQNEQIRQLLPMFELGGMFSQPSPSYGRGGYGLDDRRRSVRGGW